MDRNPHIVLIAAMAANRVIGRDNTIPWHLPGDLARFKRITMGHPVIMGRRTYQSIGRALPGRRNIVLTRNANFTAADCEVVASLDEALRRCDGEEKVFIIGGEQLYRDAMPLADEIILTVLDREVEGDTRFPEVPEELFRPVHTAQDDAPPGCTIRTLQRIR